MNREQMIAIGISAALVYVSVSGMVKNKALATGLLAIGAVGIAKRTPVVNQYV